MRSNFLTQKWENAAKYAKLILASGQLNNTIRLEAEYSNALSNYNLKNYSEATPSLEWLVKNTTTVTGAEAKFLLAEMYYDLKELDKSDAEVRALIKMKPSYNYWVAKALILQARTLILKDDLFQTEETLQSVIEHYPNKEDGIIAEANEVWEELMLLKNTEKDIAPKTTTEIDVNEESNDK
jgi:TolA-binding protein